MIKGTILLIASSAPTGQATPKTTIIRRLIGIFVESFALKWDLPQVARVFLTVGICGGFTTFSTFSLESYLLMDRGELWPAAAYMVGSVLLSILGLFAGLQLVRAI